MKKGLQLLMVLGRSPREFVTRTIAIAEGHWGARRDCGVLHGTKDFDAGLDAVSGSVGSDLASVLREGTLSEIERRVGEKQSAPKAGPFGAFHNGDSTLARLCYAVARALRAGSVIETGVCYGVTSAYLLKALQVNGGGQLHSIDLPPLGRNADDYVGWLVPEELRGRWTLHRGTSGRLLKPLLSKLGQIDLFIHDSLHTYRNMRNEFALAWPALRPGGVLISDDIEGNPAFLELSRLPEVAASTVIQEEGKEALLGVAVKKK